MCNGSHQETSPKQVREVLCSRGFTMQCLGPAAFHAGPMPAAAKPCSVCTMLTTEPKLSSYLYPLLSAALLATSCCGAVLGICICRRLRANKDGFHVQDGVQGACSLRNLEGLEATFHVRRPTLTSLNSTVAGQESALDRAELGVTNHQSSVTSASMDAEVSTKTHVLWDVDLDQVSMFFARQGSGLWQHELSLTREQSIRREQSVQREHSKLFQQNGLVSGVPRRQESVSSLQSLPLPEDRVENYHSSQRSRSGTLLGVAASPKQQVRSCDSLEVSHL